MRNTKQAQKGLTILMLMGILAIVGILATIAMRAYTNS